MDHALASGLLAPAYAWVKEAMEYYGGDPGDLTPEDAATWGGTSPDPEPGPIIVHAMIDAARDLVRTLAYDVVTVQRLVELGERPTRSSTATAVSIGFALGRYWQAPLESFDRVLAHALATGLLAREYSWLGDLLAYGGGYQLDDLASAARIWSYPAPDADPAPVVAAALVASARDLLAIDPGNADFAALAAMLR
ncbi:MAG TPA: hypothetical protein VGM88_32940 [Kofleriaceae bacterium]